MVIWPQIAGFLLVGYLSMTRSFAYLGIPQLSIFIGEIVLTAFLLLKPRVALGTWAASLLRSSPLNAMGLALLVFVLYGILQVGRGVLNGSSVFYTFKFFIFNYYTIYLFLGIWIGLRAPDHLLRLVRVIAWVNGIYGLLWIVALNPSRGYVVAMMPGADVTLFGQPGGGTAAILGMLCFERNLRAVWPLLALNIIVTLALQVRAEWLGLALGVLVWGALTRRLNRVVAIGMAGLGVIGMIELAGIQLPGRNAGTEVSLGETLGRAIAPINTELAKKLSPNAKKAASTAEWRELWWEHIWLSVHSAPMLEAFGHGYGFDLFGLAPEEVRAGQEDLDVRTPHSVFYFALGYTGWVGVALFGVLQFTILRLLWQAFRVSGQPAGVVWWVMGMSMACFEQSFDTPYRAIPFYLLVGMAMAPALWSKRELDAPPARAQSLAAVGPRGSRP
jgi:hypothetical protein